MERDVPFTLIKCQLHVTLLWDPSFRKGDSSPYHSKISVISVFLFYSLNLILVIVCYRFLLLGENNLRGKGTVLVIVIFLVFFPLLFFPFAFLLLPSFTHSFTHSFYKYHVVVMCYTSFGLSNLVLSSQSLLSSLYCEPGQLFHSSHSKAVCWWNETELKFKYTWRLVPVWISITLPSF